MKHLLGTSLTALALVGSLAACSTAGSKSAMRGTTAFGKKIDSANIGVATRAQMALQANDIATATDLAERAVENSPNDAGFRTLLGNCYMAAGRFASAEAAYRDSLTLIGHQPQVALKLALAQIANGRDLEAVSLLQSASAMIDAGDLGLALALAGRADTAVSVLDGAARQAGADARVRQNLALAYALAGDWDQARAVAAQDVPAEQLDARMQSWMTLAKPGQANARIASFIGVPAGVGDPGQPVRLALNPGSGSRLAAVAPSPLPPVAAAISVPAPQAMIALAPAPTPLVAPVLQSSPPQVAAQPAPAAIAPVADTPVVPVTAVSAAISPVAVEKPVAKPAAIALRAPRPALTPAASRLSDPAPSVRRAAAPRPMVSGRSKTVVQLGAYSSRDRIGEAWNRASDKFSRLRDYQPVTARFDGAQGTVYRLSVQGFASTREAVGFCAELKRLGGTCFVRQSSGDAPVRMASR